LNSELKWAINKHDYMTCWHLLAHTCAKEYYESVAALRAMKMWCPVKLEETRLAKYLNNPRRLCYEKHVRLLMYAKELKLVPRKRLTRYPHVAYNMYAKARVN
jgi:hypothetical protein